MFAGLGFAHTDLLSAFSAEDMIEKNIRVNNEFYVCPVFNQAIADNKKIRTFNTENMWGLGTPEDLNYYIKNYNQK